MERLFKYLVFLNIICFGTILYFWFQKEIVLEKEHELTHSFWIIVSTILSAALVSIVSFVLALKHRRFSYIVIVNVVLGIYLSITFLAKPTMELRDCNMSQCYYLDLTNKSEFKLNYYSRKDNILFRGFYSIKNGEIFLSLERISNNQTSESDFLDLKSSSSVKCHFDFLEIEYEFLKIIKDQPHL